MVKVSFFYMLGDLTCKMGKPRSVALNSKMAAKWKLDLKKYANKMSHLWTAKNFPKIVKVCNGMTECVKRH